MKQEKKNTSGPNDAYGIVWATFIIAAIPKPFHPLKTLKVSKNSS